MLFILRLHFIARCGAHCFCGYMISLKFMTFHDVDYEQLV